MLGIKHSDSLTLWSLEAELVQAYQQVEEATTDEERNLALQVLDIYLTASVEKRDRVGGFLEHLDNQELAIEVELDRLRCRKGKLASTKQQMHSYILAVMERAGVKKLEGKLFTFTSKNNPPSVEIVDELAIAPEYLVQPDPPPPKPDKRKILEELKRGNEVDGTKLVQRKRLEVS
jgi:hypothetical protein